MEGTPRIGRLPGPGSSCPAGVDKADAAGGAAAQRWIPSRAGPGCSRLRGNWGLNGGVLILGGTPFVAGLKEKPKGRPPTREKAAPQTGGYPLVSL